MFYLTTHSTHFIYGYMALDIWLRTTQIVREETRCRHMSYSFRLAARVLLYASSHRQDSTYHSFCYTSRRTLDETRNSKWVLHEGSIRRPIAPLIRISARHRLLQNKIYYKYPHYTMRKVSSMCTCCYIGYRKHPDYAVTKEGRKRFI